MEKIRRGVFETNSSSTHSITMCMKSDFDRWKNGEVFRCEWGDKEWLTREEALERLRTDKYSPIEHPEDLDEDQLLEKLYDDGVYTYDTYWNEYLEGFEDEFTTPNGDTVIAFGQYGHD